MHLPAEDGFKYSPSHTHFLELLRRFKYFIKIVNVFHEINVGCRSVRQEGEMKIIGLP